MGRKKAQHVGQAVHRQASTATTTDSKTRKLMAELKRQESALASETAKSIRMAKLHESSKITQNLRLREIQSESEKMAIMHQKTKGRLEERKIEEEVKCAALKDASARVEPNAERRLRITRNNIVHFLNHQNKAVRDQLKENATVEFEWQTCQICVVDYTSDNPPMILHCGHTFCSTCIKTLAEETGKIICPNDRTENFETEITKNQTLLDFAK